MDLDAYLQGYRVVVVGGRGVRTDRGDFTRKDAYEHARSLESRGIRAGVLPPGMYAEDVRDIAEVRIGDAVPAVS